MNEIVGILGLAIRARRVAVGEIVLKEVRSGKAKLVLIDEEIGENSRKKLLDKCGFYKVPCAFVKHDVMAEAAARRNFKAIAILDEGFAQKLQTCLKG